MRAALRRFHTPLFVAVCAVGAALSVGMGLVEVGNRPPVEVGDESEERSGLTSVVETEVSNVSDVARCPEIRIAARDRDDGDLAELVAEPVDGDGRLEPGESETYRAVFTELTAQEYDEELKEFFAYAREAEECPGPSSG